MRLLSKPAIDTELKPSIQTTGANANILIDAAKRRASTDSNDIQGDGFSAEKQKKKPRYHSECDDLQVFNKKSSPKSPPPSLPDEVLLADGKTNAAMEPVDQSDEEETSECDSEGRGVHNTEMRRATDSDECEHKHDEYWPMAATLIGLQHANHTSSSAKVKLPWMRETVFHWQWLSIFVCVMFNRGQDGQYGALLGDEMGLGKTWQGAGVGVIRQWLIWQWSRIEQEWHSPSASPEHCARDAPLGSKCSAQKHRLQCPCEPDSPFHQLRPSPGCTIFFVQNGKVNDWISELNRIIDWAAMKVKLEIRHDNHGLDGQTIKKLRTKVDSADPNAVLRPTSANNHEAVYGVPSEESTFIWLLTTWQTWTKADLHLFTDTHRYRRQEGKIRFNEEQKIGRFHCGLAVIDEVHNTKGVGKGPFAPLQAMRTQRPSQRFWFVAMSGTIVAETPDDIAASLSIIGHEDWAADNHPLHPFSVQGLHDLTRSLNAWIDDPTNEKKRSKSRESIDAFAVLLPRFLIRRTEDSTWMGQLLVNLPPRYDRVETVPFPAEFEVALQDVAKQWAEGQLAKLKRMQATWDEKSANKTWLARNPTRPDKLGRNMAFDAARMLRCCSILPYMAVLCKNHPEQEWTNNGVASTCIEPATGRMRQGSILDEAYLELRKSPRIVHAASCIKAHQCPPTLVSSSFTEVILVFERYLRESGDIDCAPQMYYGSAQKRIDAKAAFMQERDKTTNAPNVLLGTIRQLAEGHNLQRATLVLLIEPIYDRRMFNQFPKRAHRPGQRSMVYFYVFTSATNIEMYVDKKRESKAGFTQAAIRKVANLGEETGGSRNPIILDE
ncbi:MAG: hypothetical protein Q9182_006733 [Xanthomendoza sp. 2 TL-2023]